ncbi:hypothetical protein HispidOSU_003115, partial [Sigmodon hispidus]
TTQRPIWILPCVVSKDISSIPHFQRCRAESSQVLLFLCMALDITHTQDTHIPNKTSFEDRLAFRMLELQVASHDYVPLNPQFPASCLAALSIYKWKRKPDYFYRTEGE